MADSQNAPVIPQTSAQGALADYIDKLFKEAARSRMAEEKEWGTAGLFDQQKQWLEEDPETKKLRPIRRSRSDKWPMPVTNLFSRSISTNGNALGADVPRMRALSANYEGQNRRAADAAEMVIDAANIESGMTVINPRLAHAVPLWGIVAVYDTIAFDHSTVEVPQADPTQAPPATAEPEGPGSAQGSQPSSAAQPAAPGTPAEPDAVSGQQPGQDVDATPADEAMGVQSVPTARLKSILLTPFEFYLPRDAQDANLASWKLIRVRLPLGEAKENYPDFADKFTKDDANTDLAFYYLNMLRSLQTQNAKSNEAGQEYCTLTHLWTDWVSLPEDVQKKITGEWQSESSEIYEEQGFTKLQAAIEYGLFVVTWQGQVIQWAENPWEDRSPVTFFCWQKDCVSVYPKGLSVELIPLIKKLNRIDSLLEKCAMTNAAAKWVVPNTQTGVKLSGDPSDTIYWDPIGVGKEKPEFVQGSWPVALQGYRESIVADIEKLSFDNSVAEGEMPGAGTAFRALAYLGSKAEETRKTHRYLWDQAHEMRAKTLVVMAGKVWTEPRKAEVRGFNNRFGMKELEVADLKGEYEIQVIQDSSRPKTLTEKLETIQLAQAAGLINPQDVATREYTLNILGLDELDEADHLQFMKADRDLEKLKQGIQPMESPFEKWEIPLRVVANFTLTEEFEELPDNVRNGILMYAQYLSEKMSVANGAPLGMPPPPPGPPGPPQGGKPPKAGVGGQSPSHVLGQVPGAQVSPSQVQGAAIREAANVVPNSPSPTA